MIIDDLQNRISKILSIKQRLSLEETFFNGNIKRVSLRDVSGINNDHLYEQWVQKHGNDVLYIKTIHDAIIANVWENIMNILDKNLSPKEVRAINRYLSTDINQTEMKLTPESKKTVTQALQSKIGNRFDFIGPPNNN